MRMGIMVRYNIIALKYISEVHDTYLDGGIVSFVDAHWEFLMQLCLGARSSRRSACERWLC
jgi:hypothetical protein